MNASPGAKRVARRILRILFFIFLLANVVAFFHAWKFTHFSGERSVKSSSDDLSFADKLKTLLFGIDNPRPVAKAKPARAFETITIQSNKKVECWLIKSDSAKGTVILFHGYGGEKSSMLEKAEEFLHAGYNALLVDFMGAGGSEGNQTTVGYKEAEQVRSCYDFLSERGEKKIFFFGTSLGAAAILKCLHDNKIKPAGIIIECPFSSLYQTTVARFNSLNVPSFPMASLLVFWGGVQNGFWGFSHRPVDYASSVTCPVLFFYGEKDKKVSREETNAIFNNLRGPKRLITFPEAGHENYLLRYKKDWTKEVTSFVDQH